MVAVEVGGVYFIEILSVFEIVCPYLFALLYAEPFVQFKTDCCIDKPFEKFYFIVLLKAAGKPYLFQNFMCFIKLLLLKEMAKAGELSVHC